MLEMNPVGKPYEGKPHVRFDEGGLAEKPVSTLPNETSSYRRSGKEEPSRLEAISSLKKQKY
jgi:hypothetical protein